MSKILSFQCLLVCCIGLFAAWTTHGETVASSSSAKSVWFDGTVTKTNTVEFLVSTTEFTVELALKAQSSVANEGIARLNRSGSSEGCVIWALGFADDAGHLKVKVDTSEAEGQVVSFDEGASFADGKWHHVGIRFAAATDPSDTAISLYRDGALVGTQTISGRVMTTVPYHNSVLGAGDQGAPNLTGWIGEIRVSPSLVAPGDFLKVKRDSLVISYW